MPCKIFNEGNEPLREFQFDSTFIKVVIYIEHFTPFTSWWSKEGRKRKEGTKAMLKDTVYENF